MEKKDLRKRPLTFTIEQVKECLDKGMTIHAIAKQYGTYNKKVTDALVAAGLPLPRKTNMTLIEEFGTDPVKIFGAPLDQFRSKKEIQNRTGFTIRRIDGALRELKALGYETDHIMERFDARKVVNSYETPPFTKEELAESLEYNNMRQIARKYSIPYHHVKKWAVEYGVWTGERLKSPSTKIRQPKDFVLKVFEENNITGAMRVLNTTGAAIRRFCKEQGCEGPVSQQEAWAEERERRYEFALSIKDELFRLHNDEKIPLKSIAKTYDFNVVHLFKWWRSWGYEVNSPQRSVGEIEVEAFLREISGRNFTNTKFEYKDKKFEIDCFCDELKFGVEYNGIYWHSGGIGKRHANKQRWCQEMGIKLFTIFEDEWIDRNKREIVKSMLRQRVGKIDRRLHARKLVFKRVKRELAKEFFLKNHLSGHAPATYYYGLYEGDELVSCMSFGRPRFKKDADIEIIRFATALNTSVSGALSRLVSRARGEIGFNSIMSFADLRFGWGEGYTKSGFEKTERTRPGYRYYKKREGQSTHFDSFPRQRFQKHKLADLLEFFDPSLSEVENMERNGYLLMYDCGNNKFIKTY